MFEEELKVLLNKYPNDDVVKYIKESLAKRCPGGVLPIEYINIYKLGNLTLCNKCKERNELNKHIIADRAPVMKYCDICKSTYYAYEYDKGDQC